MFGIDDAIYGAGAAASAYASWRGQKDANEANQKMSQEQMKFQERMSNTAYQRSAADLRAAGLNPILALTKGPATVPSGSMANAVSETAGAVNSAKDAIAMKAQLANIQAQNDKLVSDRVLNEALTTSAAQNALLLSNSARKVKAEAHLIENAAPGSDKDRKVAESTWGTVSRWANSFANTAGNVMGVVSPIGGLLKAARPFVPTKLPNSTRPY